MKTIDKLHLIENVWRNYIWDYEFLREKLNFNDELKTNYVGVIFGYFNDTLPIINNYINDKSNVSQNNQFLNSIGLLQIIYLQQDLIIELNKSFGFSHNLKINSNRELRNELIGHPISRYKNKSLKSFCLFGYGTSKNKIVYLKYADKTNFKFEAKEYLTEEIIENHLLLLNENFDSIINKIKALFREFKKELIVLLNNTEKIDSINFETILNEVKVKFNDFLESDKVFTYDNILKCNSKKDSHSRYEYNINLFLKELKSSLIENLNNINQEYLNIKEIIDNEYLSLESNYTFGKLYENHPVFGIEYFKEKFSDDKIVIQELENMQENIGNDFEYYSSYNYLQYLLNSNYPDFFKD